MHPLPLLNPKEIFDAFLLLGIEMKSARPTAKERAGREEERTILIKTSFIKVT